MKIIQVPLQVRTLLSSKARSYAESLINRYVEITVDDT